MHWPKLKKKIQFLTSLSYFQLQYLKYVKLLQHFVILSSAPFLLLTNCVWSSLLLYNLMTGSIKLVYSSKCTQLTQAVTQTRKAKVRNHFNTQIQSSKLVSKLISKSKTSLHWNQILSVIVLYISLHFSIFNIIMFTGKTWCANLLYFRI